VKLGEARQSLTALRAGWLLWRSYRDDDECRLLDRRPATKRLEPGISHGDVSLRNPVVAPRTATIHTLVTLGISIRMKPPVF
jgi:hypothetical protein